MLLTLIGIWPENAVLISMCCVGILVGQAYWVFDFLVNAAGYSLTGMTDYMFQSEHSLFLRLLSLYHAWMPFLLVYLPPYVWLAGLLLGLPIFVFAPTHYVLTRIVPKVR